MIERLAHAWAMALAGCVLVAGCDGGGGEAAREIVFRARFVDAIAPDSGPLVGVEVCVAEGADLACATTDSAGAVEMLLPVDSEMLLRCEGANHGPAYMTLAIGRDDLDVGTFSLLNTQFQDAFVELAGATSWPTTGAVTANVYEDLERRDVRVAGVTVSMSPAGGGLTYVGEAKLPDQTATSSTLGGPALFYDRAAGQEVVVTVSHPTRTCRGGFGWPTDDTRALRTRIYAGALANVTFVCPP